MTGDLFIPILIIIVMYIVIDEIEGALKLGMIGLLFIPIAVIMSQAVAAGEFNKLFGATITTDQAGFINISIVMFTIPIFAITKIYYNQYLLKKEKTKKEENNGAD